MDTKIDSMTYLYWSIAEPRRHIHRKLTKRWDLVSRIYEYSHNGKTAINTGGRDCDMAEWDGDIRIIASNWYAFEELCYALEMNAEGPWWAYPIPWEDQEVVTYQSNDLALEAFEDGHQHIVYPRLGMGGAA